MSRGHYFDPEPSVDAGDGARRVTLALPDVTLRLATARGVFSAERVDPGTRVPLGSDERPAGADLVDLGCGYGPIACTLARRAPAATVWAVDPNRRARELCAANAAAADLPNVRVIAPDEVPGGLAADEVWSNPPIRIGKQALHDLLLSWLARLRPTGRMVLVVQRHLGADSLAAWLTDAGWPTRRIVSRQGYRLLEVRRGEPATH